MENEIKHSINIINKTVNKNTGFSVPDNYFDELDKEIYHKIINEKLPKNTGFNIPNTYFDSIEDSILTKAKVKQTKVITFKKRILKKIPLVAAACVILFLSLNLFNSNQEINLDALSSNDIEYWLELNSLNNNDITLILEDEILRENDFSMINIKDKDLEDYMISIDNNLLFEGIN
jgi:hypothetical protein